VASLTLDRTGSGSYRLDGVGTLRRTRRFGAAIESGAQSWELSRTLFGFGQIIVAVDRASGTRAARYVPHGPLHLRGIHGGAIEAGPRRYAWRAAGAMAARFTLAAGGSELARLEAGPPAQPVQIELPDRTAVEPMVLLLCCHIVMQGAYAAQAGMAAAVGVATGG